ncbi:TPA: lysozyme inhibitor LprI family protein [Acinetobacter baumannii]
MKKILLIATSLLSVTTFAGSVDSGLQKLDKEIKGLKSELNTQYKKAYSQTEAKQELDNSQKAWLKYKELQCGDFVVADTEGSPATVEYDLTCQSILYKQRIAFLKEMFRQ